MNRDLSKRLGKLEARQGDALDRMSDEALIAAIKNAEARLKAMLGDGWDSQYRDQLAETLPHLLAAWDAQCDAIRQLEATA